MGDGIRPLGLQEPGMPTQDAAGHVCSHGGVVRDDGPTIGQQVRGPAGGVVSGAGRHSRFQTEAQEEVFRALMW